MTLKAVSILELDFSPYGKVLDLIHGGEGLHLSHGDDYRDVCTAVPIIDTPASMGCTVGAPVPFTTGMMERHWHTQEAQFCAKEPIVFLVAPPTPAGISPKAEDVTAVLLPMGYAVVLEREVWHSASHCLHTEAAYYWLAHVYPGEPTEWNKISDGPIQVEM